MDEELSRFLVVLAVGLILLAWGLVRLVRDRRRAATGLWLLAGGLLTWVGLAALVSAVSPALGLFMFYGLLIGGFLLVVGVSLALIANGYYVMMRYGVNLARALPLAAGLATFAATILIVYINSSAFVRALESASPQTNLRVLALAMWYILVVGYVGFNLVAYALQAWIHSLWPREERYDAVVVLGAGLIGERVTPLLAGRLDRGIGIARDAGARVIVCSGGQGSDEVISEAEAMSRYVHEVSGDKFTVLKEDRSTTTRENLLFTRELLEKVGADALAAGADMVTTPEGDPEFSKPGERPLRVAVATSNFHALRAGGLARQLGLPWHVYGSPTALYYIPTSFLREFAANMVFHWRLHAAVVGLLTLFIALLAMM
ncbi:uncharacterized SAM-binding protein YcdF (DUF218 family) [Arcanobacterium wilhelmae]|uniref:Uncharacterized SAM-binding protein YcdF (DUF218 family) n=1 Tax=Arcanobacterium wilhelmae TaxID=1803177 RepID=A0ABT9NDW8_9ACTO|nr:YdcF family protein [Arcanobacterium wilhelmae]MDP9801571.1 uncharacterized SAM-binding protein YcdF (DUF218 family) [Arcanobacterium wilhelmae]WFN90898.1 YdcF family protein [Arcanobacterium wilhelmae]